MTRSRSLIFLLFFLCLLPMFILTGCGEDKSGNTIDEPEITADYLSGEYAEQLLTDGAETMLGFVTIENNDGTYAVTITEKEVVPSSDYEEGYYIADTNVTKEVTLGLDARIVCTHDDELVVSNADDFIEEHPDGSEQLYTIYLMGTSAELILATEPGSVLAE